MNCVTCPYLSKTEYCAKVGDVITSSNCYEEEEEVMPRVFQKPRKWNRYERKQRYKAKLKRLSEMNLSYPAPVYPVGDYDMHSHKWENIKYYKRYYKTNHVPGNSGYLKKLANKRVRRYTGEMPNRCGYKKTFDYWWELT